MKKRCSIFVALLLLLNGCAHLTEVQYQAYAVGMGLDYKDKQYTVYLLFLDFTNVAKAEQTVKSSQTPVWIAEGHGSTIDEAISRIYEGLQIRANYDQITLFLFSEELLKSTKLRESLYTFVSNFNFRTTGWMYGTNENIKDVFTTQIPFYYPFTASQLNQPFETQHQSAKIPPLRFEELLYSLNEKTKTIAIPAIDIEENIIYENRKEFPVTSFRGAYYIKENKYQGFFSEREIEGFVRMNNDAERVLMNLFEEKEQPLSIELRSPRIKRNVSKKNGELQYELNIHMSAILRNGAEMHHPEKVKKEITKILKKEIAASVQRAGEQNIDLYNFEDYMYRFERKLWKDYQKNKTPIILKEENINIVISPLKSVGKINNK